MMNVPFSGLEYVEGTDLFHLLIERGPLPVVQACEYIRQAALGLQHAHANGLVHRDIKPQNLLLSRDGKTIKLLDLGLALLPQAGAGDEESAGGPRALPTAVPDGVSILTVEGALMGTPDFMAPDQAEDSHGVDGRADVYALGATLYFLLSGQLPFPGTSLYQKLHRLREEEPAPLEQLCPDLASGLAPLVRRMMAKRPEDRMQTPAFFVG